MKKSVYLIAICCSLLLFSSCEKGKGGIKVKVDNFSNGKAGEIILIMDDKSWSESDKNAVKEELTQPQPAINQIEPMFDILEFQNNDFSATFQRHRNIVRFEISPDFPNNIFDIEKNTWSSPQVYIHIKGNDPKECLQLFMDNKDLIIRELYDNDLKRVQSSFSKNPNQEVEKLVREKFGISLTVSNQYFVAGDEANFLWLRFRTNRNDRFIMIYKTPMSELTGEKLMDVRDSVTKALIPGAVPGAYPIIARKLGFPIINPVTVGNREGMEMRGLWETVNDKMGGPFYSFSFLDPSGENCITVDGFVYAPDETKRDYLREVEGIVKTTR